MLDIFTSTNFLQSLNAKFPIFPLLSCILSSFDIFNFTIPLLSNEYSPISFTLLGIVTSNNPGHVQNNLSAIFSVPSSNDTYFRFVQPVNAPPTLSNIAVVMLFGISISSNPVQFRNDTAPIVVILFDIFTSTKSLQLSNA